MANNIDAMKELYASGDYVCYMEWEDEKGLWFTEEPEWDGGFTYKLIHKNDAHIAKAVAEDSSVEIECTKWDDEGNTIENDISKGFFETYNVNWDYELKESKPKQETISISDGDKVYEFEKPNFKCELLKVFQGTKDLSIIGYFVGNNGESYPCEWTSNGRIWKTSVRGEDRVPFNLTPVKQKKEKANVPALIVRGQCPSSPEFPNEVTLCWSGEYFKNNLKKAGWRLATKAERDSLFCLDIDAISSKETN